MKTGDLLFQTGKESDFEKAIKISSHNRAKDYNFSHVGVVIIEEGVAFVIEAEPEMGVGKKDLHAFLQESNHTFVGRLKKNYTNCIDKSIENIIANLGLPYNYCFIPNNNSYYCSELIQDCFKDNEESNIFLTKPMTFISNGDTLPFWKQYFQEYKCPIPEGILGSNPNSIAASKAITIIGNIGLTK